MAKFFGFLFKLVKPPQFNSWQTFTALAVFFFISAIAANDFLREVLAFTSFICLGIGVTWAGLEQSWVITPWLTSAFICLFLRGLFNISPQILLLGWLPGAACLAIIPHCVRSDFSWHPPNLASRRYLTILFASQLLLTCWLEFFFVVQGWIVAYPSLLVDDFSQSLFVRQVQMGTEPLPRSIQLLNLLRPAIEMQLGNKDWPTMERWLQQLYTVPHRMDDLVVPALAKADWPNLPENEFWQVTAIASPSPDRPDGYQLRWIAQWTGPRSPAAEENNPYDSDLLCTLYPENQASYVECNEARQINAPTSEDLTPFLE